MKLKRMLDEYQLAQANYNKFKLPDDLAKMDSLYDRMIERERSLMENNKVLVDVVKNVASLGMNNAYYALVQDARWALEKIGDRE